MDRDLVLYVKVDEPNKPRLIHQVAINFNRTFDNALENNASSEIGERIGGSDAKSCTEFQTGWSENGAHFRYRPVWLDDGPWYTASETSIEGTDKFFISLSSLVKSW